MSQKAQVYFLIFLDHTTTMHNMNKLTPGETKK